jgi:hypothetical protein
VVTPSEPISSRLTASTALSRRSNVLRLKVVSITKELHHARLIVEARRGRCPVALRPISSL